jgi:hypothetical protein
MKKKVAYVINHLSFFYSHVMPQALEARKQGFEIKFDDKEMDVYNKVVDAVMYQVLNTNDKPNPYFKKD